MADLFVKAGVVIPDGELEVQFARSGGPGGQNVNKVATKVEVRFNPSTSRALTDYDRTWLLQRLATKLTGQGELIVTSDLTRNQGQNRRDALEKLAALLREALKRPKHRRATRPTRGSVERRIDAKRRRSDIKRQRRNWD